MKTIKFLCGWKSFGFINGTNTFCSFDFNERDTCNVCEIDDKVKLCLNNGDSFILPKTGCCGFKNYQEFLNREHELFEFVN